MAVATPIPSCLGLGSYTSGSPAIVEAWFHGLQRGWRPHYTPTLGFHLIYRGKGPLKENAKASYEGSLPGVALDGGLVPALPRTRLEVSLPKGPIQTQKGRTLVCTLLGPAALVNVGCEECANVGFPNVNRFDGHSKYISCRIIRAIQPGHHALMSARDFQTETGFLAGLYCPQPGCKRRHIPLGT